MGCSLLALWWMPWQQVHPNDPSLRRTLGYAPYWSHRFASVTGAHIDWGSLGINLLVIWVICAAAALMFGISTHDD